MVSAPMEVVDVLIVGSGSAGLCAATWLARYGRKCKVLEKRPRALEVGQADGVQCRTVEIFESFGVAEDMLREAYHVSEVNFWAASPTTKTSIVRTGRTADVAPGLSHMPHVILNQARVNGMLLELMKKWNDQEVEYGYEVQSVEVKSLEEPFPVEVVALRDGKEVRMRAKYVLGCDGAHSMVRRSLGYKMIGDSTDSVWGVMDVYPRTTFPDVRKKCTIRSSSGNVLIIPREGDSLCRFYIELPKGTIAKEVTFDRLLASAKAALAPYEFEVAEVFWWSAYSIGQRLVDHFSKDDRVFLTGDACHTHSPKAGQGMNCSLQDGYNIGWKLGMILTGQASPDLIKTYDLERQKVAAALIDFDRYFTKLFSSTSTATPEEFNEAFKKSGRYTAGFTSQYDDSTITSRQRSKAELAKGLDIGMRFPSTLVARMSDVHAMQLVRAFPSDGRWRIVVFPGDISRPCRLEKLKGLGAFLEAADGPVRRHTASSKDIDSVIESVVVLSGAKESFEYSQIPEYFWPVNGKWQMRDLHKIYIDDAGYNSPHGHAYDLYGIDPAVGALVVLRPDHHVALVTSLDDHEALSGFFSGFMLPQA